MYRVVQIENDEMTRRVHLQNLTTGTIDICFDDSSILSVQNFNFMQEGQIYDCKIKLFGNIVLDTNEQGVVCIIDREIHIGNQKMMKVLIDNDEYYISTKKFNERLDSFPKKIKFRCLRKDLIKVDDVIHADLLF